jgi:hypothetical protein
MTMSVLDRRGGLPGGGGGGPPDDGPGGNPSDRPCAPRRPRRAESEDDSEVDVADRTRSKGELPLKLPTLPKSAGELEGYRFAVINYIALASGRHRKRIPWIEDTAKARRPEELEHVPRKNASLGYKISIAALASCQNHNAVWYPTT